jgi:hypothetical protein
MRNVMCQKISVALLLCLVGAPVGARAAAPADRYTIAAGTVFDAKTKLTWQQSVPTTTSTLASATAYCSTLSLVGLAWRLPTLMELMTIVDYSVSVPSIDSSAFPATPPSGFWTSTPTTGSGGVWDVDFFFGQSGAGILAGTAYVRCVR